MQAGAIAGNACRNLDFVFDVFDKKYRFDKVLTPLLKKLSLGVQVRGHLHGSREQALAVLAFTFSKELTQPLGEIE